MPSDIDIYPQPNVEPHRADPEAESPPVTEPLPPQGDMEPPAVDLLIESQTDDPPVAAAPSVDSAPAPFESSTSGDDLTVSLSQARPDPLLGAFVTEESPGDSESPASQSVTIDTEPQPVAEVVDPGLHGGSRADAMNDLAAIDLGGETPAIGPGASVSSFDGLGGIDLSAPPPAPATATRPEPAMAEDEDDEDEDDDELPPARGPSLLVMLLASYASAVTLGLIWVLVSGRRLHESEDVDTPLSAESQADPGSRAGSARRIAPPKPIPAEHLAALGKTIRLGQIEATPIAVTSGPVVLERNFEGHERKPGGENALKLRLRLKNVSTDTTLAPLDEAFVRDRPRADPDSFIETSTGEPPIAQFPLAVESEWSIVGQEFRDLKPGEQLETQVVSARDALAHKAPEMTWRIRLRTNLNHTDDLGVRFHESDIKPGP